MNACRKLCNTKNMHDSPPQFEVCTKDQQLTETQGPCPGDMHQSPYRTDRFSLLHLSDLSGREVGLPGRVSAGFESGKLQNRPSGRPKAGQRADFEAFPTRIRPKPSPEARSPARRHTERPTSWIQTELTLQLVFRHVFAQLDRRSQLGAPREAET